MTKLKLYAAPLLILGLAASCAKSVEPENQDPKEIVLCVGGDTIDMQVQTKTTAITDVPSSLYYSMTTGTLGSETSKKVSASGNVGSGKIATGVYQTLSPTSYNYYVSNAAIAFSASGSTISAANTTDVIAGKVTSNKTNPTVTLNHVFARTGGLTLNSQSGYALSNVSWSIESISGGTGGTYNIAKNNWTSVTALSSTSLTETSDLYLVPGDYTLSVTYTLTKGDWNQTFTKKATVTLAAGNVNNITGTASGGNASEISISVTLTEWGTNNITATFS
ncbi:MAG: hypothetical protein ACI3Y4_00400 [Candidatus Cryptobacteroides sp.]